MRVPFQRTSPWLGVSRPQRMRSRLVLPVPLAPAMRSDSPLRSANERPRNSVRPPRSHSSSVASSTAGLLQKGPPPLRRKPLLRGFFSRGALTLLQPFGEPDEDAVGERGEVLRHHLGRLERGTPLLLDRLAHLIAELLHRRLDLRRGLEADRLL